VRIVPMKEPLSCTHLRTYHCLKIHKHVQGLEETVGIDSLAPGDINGVHPPFVVKEGHVPGSIDRDLNRAASPLLKPLLSHFFGLRCVEL
jgi:hypothetical protein